MKIARISLYFLAFTVLNTSAHAAEFSTIASCKFDGYPIMVMKFKPDGYSHLIQIGDNKELELMKGAGSSPMITASDGPAHYSFNLRLPYSITVIYDGASNGITKDGECIFTEVQ